LSKAITFDLWNTLITDRDYTDFRVNSLVNILNNLKFVISQEEIHEAFINSNELARIIEEGKNHRYVTTEERLVYIKRNLGINLPPDGNRTIVKELSETFWKNPPSLKKGVFETLKTLKPNYKIGLICDTGITPSHIVRCFMRKEGILHFFSSTIFSDEMSLCKPDRAMFDTALKELDVKPYEAVHVGDLLHTDIAGAKAIGMKTIWVNDKKTPRTGRWAPDYEITEISQILSLL